MKKESVVFIVIILIVLGLLAWFLSGRIKSSSDIVSGECTFDNDCVASDCCHATQCVAIGKAPECSGIACTMDCKPGTLDCGQGSCKCNSGKCGAVLNK